MRLRFTIDGTTYSLPILREGFSLDKLVGEEGRHASASSSITLQSCDETNLIIVHDGNVDAQIIEDDGTVIQTGIVRPYLSTGYKGTFREHVSMELIDYTEKLKLYVWPDPEKEEDRKPGRIYPQSWISTKLSTACAWIFSQCGVTYDLSGIEDINLPFLSITEGQTLDSVLEELLFCYGMDYTFDADGNAYIISTFAPEAISGNIVDIRGDVSLDRSDDTSDGVEVTYGVASQTNTTIYSKDSTNAFKTWWPFAHIMGQEDIHGYWYNGLMHDRIFDDFGKNPPTGRTVDWDYTKIIGLDGKPIQSSDVYKLENITVKSWVSDEITWGKNMVLKNHLVEYDLNGATFYLEYDGRFDEWFGKGWGFHTRIKADVTYRLKSTASYSVEGPNPEKVDLKYCLLVPDQDTFAQTFAENYYKRQKNGKISVSFRSLVRYEVGGFYNMAGRFPGVAGLSMAVRVTSVSMDADGIYTVEAECCSGMSITETVQKKSYGENAPDVPFGGISAGGYDEDGNADGEKGLYIGPDGTMKGTDVSLIGSFAADGFTTGVARNIPSVESELRSILFITDTESMRQCIPASALVGTPGFYVYTEGAFRTATKTITASEESPIYLYIHSTPFSNVLAYDITYADETSPLMISTIGLYSSKDGAWITNQSESENGWFSVALSGAVSRTSVDHLTPPMSAYINNGISTLTDGRRMHYYKSNIGDIGCAYNEGFFRNLSATQVNFGHNAGTVSGYSIYAHSGTSLSAVPTSQIPIGPMTIHTYGDGSRYAFGTDDGGTWRLEAQRLHGVYEFWLMYRPGAAAQDAIGSNGIDAIRVPPIPGMSDDLMSNALGSAIFEVSFHNGEGRGSSGFHQGGAYVSVANSSYDVLDGLTMHFFTGYNSGSYHNYFNRPLTIHGRFRGAWNR